MLGFENGFAFLAIYPDEDAATRTSEKITRPLLSSFRQSQAINLCRNNLVEVADPITRLGLPWLFVKHRNCGLLSFVERQRFASSLTDSGDPQLVLARWRSHLKKPSRTELVRAIEPMGAGVDLDEGETGYRLPF